MPTATPASTGYFGDQEDRGLEGYRSLLDALSARISASEAENARVLARGSMRALLVCVLVVVALGGGMAATRTLSTMTWALIPAIVPMVLGMLLVTHWRLPFGARFILLCAAIFMPSGGDLMTSGVVSSFLSQNQSPFYATTLALTGRLGVAWLLGWVIDSGARSSLGGWRRRRWTFCVFTAALLLVLLGVTQKSSDFRELLSLGIENFVRAGLLVIWASWAHSRWANAWRYSPFDIGIVFRASVTRWGRRIAGRFLALFSLIVVMIAVLNGFAVPNLLKLDGPDPAVRAYLLEPSSSNSTEYFFMWPRNGRLLRESDFRNESLRFFLSDAIDDETRTELVRADAALPGVDHRMGEFQGERLLAKLESGRLASAAAFTSALEVEPARSLEMFPIWLIERVSTSRDVSSASSAVAASEISFVSEPLFQRLQPMSRNGISRFLEACTPLMLGAGIFACLAFTILWRRGGEFGGAQWIGLWFAGIAMSFAAPIVNVANEGTFVRAARTELLSGHATSEALVHLSHGFSILLGVLAVCGFPLWLAYQRLRPAATGGSRSKAHYLLDGGIPIAIGIFGSVAILVWINFALAQMLLLSAAAGLWAFLGVGAIEWLRRRYTQPQPAADSRLRVGKAAFGMLVAAQLMFLLSLFLRTGGPTSPMLGGWIWAVLGSQVAFAVAMTVFLLRSNWMRISAGRDLSWLIAAFLMPLTFEIVNGTLPNVLEAAGFLLPGAANVASLFAVVALMQPIQRAFESAFAAFSQRSLRTIQRQIDALFDDALTDPVKGDLGSRVESLFSELGVVGYALWVRQGRCQFVPEIDRLNAQSNNLALSEGLCQRLARSKSVIDLEAVHSEWEFFFEQFELHRLARHTRARYLYRVRFGNSLGGLLLLGDSAAALGLARDGFAETASTLGLALSKWRNGNGGRDL